MAQDTGDADFYGRGGGRGGRGGGMGRAGGREGKGLGKERFSCSGPGGAAAPPCGRRRTGGGACWRYIQKPRNQNCHKRPVVTADASGALLYLLPCWRRRLESSQKRVEEVVIERRRARGLSPPTQADSVDMRSLHILAETGTRAPRGGAPSRFVKKSRSCLFAPKARPRPARLPPRGHRATARGSGSPLRLKRPPKHP